MNKIPKIVKQQPPEAVEEMADSVSSPEPPAFELVEPVEVQRLKKPGKLYTCHHPVRLRAREWQREFREVEWQDDADAWESQLYD